MAKNKDIELQKGSLQWNSFAILALGIWLIATALTFSTKSQAIFFSDISSGILLCFLGYSSIASRHKWPFWTATLVGVWLQFAPLIFWAPLAVSYVNDTFVGILIIGCSGLTSMASRNHSAPSDDTPLGWTFNPSSWLQRLPTILLCTICWLIARYMAAYQLGYLDTLWDPIFGNDGTVKVITSQLSKSFPISDAGLGALVYSLEMLLGCKGGPNRWYTMPWMVVVFGIMVVPAGIVSILLIMSQPIIVGHWCTWCLITAFCMLFMIAFTLNEVLAVLQYLWHVKKSNLSFWRIFWQGGNIIEDKKELSINTSWKKPEPSITLGVSFSWTAVICIVIGIWVMFSPPLFSIGTKVDNAYHIFGAIIITIASITINESMRAGRLINVLLGISLLVLPFIFPEEPLSEKINSFIAGALLTIFAIPKGPIHQHYGAWDHYII